MIKSVKKAVLTGAAVMVMMSFAAPAMARELTEAEWFEMARSHSFYPPYSEPCESPTALRTGANQYGGAGDCIEMIETSSPVIK